MYGKGKHNGIKGVTGDGSGGVIATAYKADATISDKGGFRDYKRNSTTRKLGVNISFGAQAELGVNVNNVNAKFSGNLGSVNLLEGNVEKSPSSSFSLNGYSLDNSDIHANLGISIPFMSYNYSYSARGEDPISGTGVHTFNAFGYNKSSDGSSGFRASASVKFLLGIEIYYEKKIK